MAEDSPEEKQSLEADRDDIQRLKEIMRRLAALEMCLLPNHLAT